MRRTIQLVAAAIPVAALVLFWSTSATATPDMGEKTKKECTVCHVEEGAPELNETGKYYKQNKKFPPAPKKK